jgi:hypothetical protein
MSQQYPVNKSANLTEEMDTWFEENAINFSKWVRQRVREEMREHHG